MEAYLLRGSEVGLAMPYLVVAGGNFDLDGAVRVGGAARIGIVGKAVLGAKFAVDAIENRAKLLRSVRIKHGAAGGVGHGFEGVLAGSVAAVFIFHRPDDDGVQKHVGADRFPASGVEVVMAGGFPGVRDQDDDTTAVVPAMGQRTGAEEHGVVNRSHGAIWHFSYRVLEGNDIIGKRRALRDVLIEGKNGQAITGPYDLADEMGGGLLLKGDFFVRAEASIDHQGQVEWLGSFWLEDVDFLFVAFIEKLKSFARQVGSRAIVLVKNADENGNEINVDADAVPLRRGILRLLFGRVRRGLNDFSGFAIGRSARRRSSCGGVRARRGIRCGLGLLGPGFLSPRRAVGVVLRKVACN